MRKILVILSSYMLVFLSANSLTAGPKGIPEKMQPPRAVNDFEGIINETSKQELETRLNDYWKKTSIAIVVVTVADFNDYSLESFANELYNYWGIGNKETNMGVLILMSVHNKKMRIEVGYGTEEFLTDAKASSIINDDMKPLCKTGNYVGALDIAVNKCIEKLGDLTREEREAMLKTKKEENARRWAIFKDILQTVLITLLTAGLLIYLIKVLVRAFKNIKYRSSLEGMISKLRGEIQEGEKVIEKSSNAFKTEAAWARQEASEHLGLAADYLYKAKDLLDAAQGMIYEDTQNAAVSIDKATDSIKIAFSSFEKGDKLLYEKIQKFAKESPRLYEEAKTALVADRMFLADCLKKGYKFQEVSTAQSELLKTLESYKDSVNDKEKQPEVCRMCPLIKKKSNEIAATIQDIVAGKMAIDMTISEKNKEARTLYNNYEMCQAILDRSENVYPESVWKQYEVTLQRLTPKLAPEKIRRIKDEIIELNKPDGGKLHLAAARYKDFLTLVTEMTKLQTNIQEMEKNQNEAHANFDECYKSASESVAKAMQRIKHADVSKNTKTSAKEASDQLAQFKIESSISLVDWVGLSEKVSAVNDKAKKAYNQAEQEITDAENERERIQRKKRDDERRRRNSYSSSYVSSSSYSSSSYSSSSSSSFGGFSGGMSGGGGASGSW